MNNKLFKYLKSLYTLINKSLKYKLITSFLFVILLPTLLYATYSYITISSSFEKNYMQNLSSFTKESITNINFQFDYLNNTSLSLLVNSQVVSLLDENPQTNIDKIILQSKFEHEVKPFLLFNPTWNDAILKSIFLFKDIEDFYYITKETSPLATIDEMIFVMEDVFSLKNFPIFVQSPNKENTFYYIRECFDLSTAQCKGYLSLEIDASLIFDFTQLEEIYPNIEFLAFDKKTDSVLATSFDDSTLSKLSNNDINLDESVSEVKIKNNKFLATTNTLNNTSLELITFIPNTDITYVSGNPMTKYLLMFLILTIICFKFYSLLYHGISDPLNNMLTHIKNVKNGDLKTKMPLYQYDELNDISDVFNNMTNEVDNLINQVYDKQLLIKESELKFLKSQMDPHFIFNVLDTINWHAKLSNHETISNLTTNLSKLLRANLSISDNEFITLREELDYIEYYINLQKSRFSDRLNVVISIADDDLLNYKIPKLCIQPLVENSIVHGIEPKPEGGTIKLQIWEDEDELFYSIVDDGVGFDTSKLATETNKPLNARKKRHNSIALNNIRRRLFLLYSDKFSINIESRIGYGSQIRVSLPLNEGDKNV